MNYRKINNISGWLVCLVACTVYLLTTEAGGSFWDCGEFVSCCYKVQIPHPPGAPLFVLLGRLFILCFGDNPLTAAKAVNSMSAVASGFTVLFLFWTITHFAKRIVLRNTKDEPGGRQVFTIIAAGIVGALVFTFSDSFWFSAVEGEVYAMSSFFSAIVFWCILKWDDSADEPGADKWLVLIFFLIGLSIGVHLLSLLDIPAVVMVWYFRKKDKIHYDRVRKYFVRFVIIGGILGVLAMLIAAQSEASSVPGAGLDGTPAALVFFGAAACIGILYAIEKIGRDKRSLFGGVFIFMALGCALELFIQVGIIQFSVKLAGKFDVLFVNAFSLPFFSGFTFFFLLLATGIWWGFRVAAKKNLYGLRLSLWCLVFLMVGYSSYITTLLRSNADTAIDMFNVDNPMSLEGYLGREQYGDFPLLYGQQFNSRPIGIVEGATRYQKGKNGYTDIGRDFKYVFAPREKMVCPRMWDMSNDQYHADYYADFLGVGKTKDGEYAIEQSPEGHPLRPNFADNLSFFVNYQNYYMYLRYFLWNFSGRQNDQQGLMVSNTRDGNWITGISFIDNALYGNQLMMPDSLKNNKAHNKLFALPLLLGLLGMFFHFRRRPGDAIANLLLFVCTGLAIIVYINQPGMQPRERDYAYAGSFYAFAVWAGIGVLYLVEMALSWDTLLVKKMATTGGVFFAVLTLLCMSAGIGGTGCIVAGAGLFVLYLVFLAALPYVFRKTPRAFVVPALTAVSLVVPLIMCSQEWDDHDRSKKQLARDLARNYLESCAPNAILFSMADNDTYPLWYAQEVEGIRPDVRVVITTLIAGDWCINQLRYKINQSDPVDPLFTADQVEGNKRNFVVYRPQAQFPQDRYYDLYDLLKNYIGDDKNVDERGYNILPVNRISIPVDEKQVRANGTVNPGDSVVNAVNFTIPKNSLYKNDLAILGVIAANQWKRPVYFTSPYGQLGFDDFLRKDGLAYRLVPVKGSDINTDRMMETIMTKFGYGNADKPGVYFDEPNRSELDMIRRASAELAIDLCNKNRKPDAQRVLERADKMIDPGNFSYGGVSRGNQHNRNSMIFWQACLYAGDTVLAGKVSASLRKDLQQQARYYRSLPEAKQDAMQYDLQSAESMLQEMDRFQLKN